MKSMRENIILKQIKDCENLNKENNNISVFIKPIQNKIEYYLNITVSKKVFTSDEILTNNSVPLDIFFILHLTPNYPINPPRLFCLTSLSAINLNICDVKDILYLVLQKEKWNSQIIAKEIILKIPEFLNNFYEKSRGMFYMGKYYLDRVYDYKIISKIPNTTYFSEIEQILNEKSKITEKRLLLITDLFFLIFSFEYGMISSYNNVKLVFWASIKSIFGMKNTDKMFQFEFSKTEKQRIFLFFYTNEGAKIMDIVLENLRKMAIDYSINKSKNSDVNLSEEKRNEIKREAKLLPNIEIDENTNKNDNNIDNENENDNEKQNINEKNQ
jgi:ubiquitin-protein ligase